MSFDDVNVVESWPIKGKSERKQGAMLLDLPNYVRATISSRYCSANHASVSNRET